MARPKTKSFDTSALVPGVVSKNIAKYLPILQEIRNRLIVVGLAFLVGAIIGFSFYERIISFILGFFSFQGVNIVFTTPFQFFSLALNCGLVIGVVCAIPILIHQILAFFKPALLPHEYRILITVLPLGILLFVGGFFYGVTMMKYVIQIFYRSSIKLQIGNFLDVESLLSNILTTGLLMGVAFLFPIVMTVFMQLRPTTREFFSRQRPIAYLIGLIFVMFLPPPDLLSDLVLFSPLVLLFELTLILNKARR